VFHGKDLIAVTSRARATASLGTLFTFALSDEVRIEGSAIEVTPQTATANPMVVQWFTNTGREPAIVTGVAAILNEAGSLVTKSSFAEKRLLPGERGQFESEVPVELKRGNYRAFVSFLCGGQTTTYSAAFTVD
jgi:hypothetical protein